MFHPQVDYSVFPILGRIISHGYLVTGFAHIARRSAANNRGTLKHFVDVLQKETRRVYKLLLDEDSENYRCMHVVIATAC